MHNITTAAPVDHCLGTYDPFLPLYVLVARLDHKILAMNFNTFTVTPYTTQISVGI